MDRGQVCWDLECPDPQALPSTAPAQARRTGPEQMNWWYQMTDDEMGRRCTLLALRRFGRYLGNHGEHTGRSAVVRSLPKAAPEDMSQRSEGTGSDSYFGRRLDYHTVSRGKK